MATPSNKTTIKTFLRVPKVRFVVVSVSVEDPLVSFEIDCVVGNMVGSMVGVGVGVGLLCFTCRVLDRREQSTMITCAATVTDSKPSTMKDTKSKIYEICDQLEDANAHVTAT